jgi:hypothetical protein
MCKVQWSNHAEDEATWEREDELKEDYPDLLLTLPNLEDEIHLKRVGFVTPKNLIIVFNKILLSNKCLFKDF